MPTRSGRRRPKEQANESGRSCRKSSGEVEGGSVSYRRRIAFFDQSDRRGEEGKIGGKRRRPMSGVLTTLSAAAFSSKCPAPSGEFRVEYRVEYRAHRRGET